MSGIFRCLLPRRATLLAVVLVAVTLRSVDSLEWTQTTYLKPHRSGGNLTFGRASAVSGNTLAIGVPETNGETGAVAVFVRSGFTWVQQAYLTPPTTDRDGFGLTVALSGDVIVVGASGESSSTGGVNGPVDNNMSGSGAAYVFRRTGTVWAIEAFLKASNPWFSDRFGTSVAVDGDTVVVGASGEDSDATGVNGDQANDRHVDSGAAYVFHRSGGSWAQQAYLKASNTDAGDEFGASTAVSGEVVLVGAPRERSLATAINGSQGNDDIHSSGAVYAFARSGGQWSQEAYLKPWRQYIGNASGFGTSLAMSGTLAVVGAPLDSLNATGVDGAHSNDDDFESGAAYVFERQNGAWQQQAYLKASNTEPADGFGTAVAAWEDAVLVGAPGEDSGARGIGGDASDNDYSGSGAAYLYRLAGGQWSFHRYIKASNTNPLHEFGISVAGGPGLFVVGARSERSSATGVNGDQTNNEVTSRGAAYVFEEVNPAPAVIAQPSNVSVTVGASATFSVTARGVPAPAYRWQESSNFGNTWTEVVNTGPYTGATTSTLVIAPAALSMTGRRYRCVVSSTEGTATSEAAILTVQTSASLTLVWNDEFGGPADTGVDTGRWRYDLGTSYPGGPANWGTGEVETMTSSTANVYQDGSGRLVIKPLHDGLSPTSGWTSGRIQTELAFGAPEGGILAVEASIQQPNVSGPAAAGYWAAFWMLGAAYRGHYQNWPAIGEIDVMEGINGLASTWATLHCGSNPGGPCNESTGLTSGQYPCPGCQTSLNTYRVELDRSASPQQIRWYLNGVNFFTIDSSQVEASAWTDATANGFHIILNVAIGGGFPAAFGGGPTAATTPGAPMMVDYVRVYQQPVTSTPPVITVAPEGRSAIEGQSASFTVAASGIPYPVYQWEESLAGAAGFVPLANSSSYAGVTSTTLTVSAARARNGASYRAVATNSGGSATSAAATLAVSFPAEITSQPAATTVTAGTTATFVVTASGNPTPAVAWQSSTDGTSWSNLADASTYSGASTQTLTVSNASVSMSGLRFRAVATNGVGSPATSQAVVLTVNPAPTLTATPGVLRYAATKTGAGGELMATTAAQAVTVTYTGPTAPQWTASSNQPWAVVSNGSGTGIGAFEVAIANPGNVLGASTSVTATISVTAANAGTSAAVPVHLTITLAPSSVTTAIGQVDTPAQDATGVQGAIGVTGWVLDNIGVTGVKIYRNCLVFENQANCQTILGQSMVFIGDAAFLAGARPDVETAFSSYPASNRAGWGYLLLTSMLPQVTTQQPNGGVGPLTIYAVATDAEGNQKILGRSSDPNSPDFATPTRITMANDTIAKPFGAIDTPAQGGTVSGTFPNFGWVLTPDSNTTGGEGGDILVPTSGSTAVVYIDSVAVATVTYNQCRGNVGNPVPPTAFCNDDVANIFGNPTPQPTFTERTTNPTLFRNLDAGRGAIGSYDVNTSAMTNGLHTMAWGVRDSAGREEGIGSRFFNVLNSGSDECGSAECGVRSAEVRGAEVRGAGVRGAEARGAASAVVGRADLLARLDAGLEGVWGRSGYGEDLPWTPMHADASGRYRARLAEQGRMQLWLGAAVEAGYLVAPDGTLRDLPVGSRLDGALFGWMPPVGYVGTYHLTFLRGGERIDVDITVWPAPPVVEGEAQIRMHLDAVRGAECGVRGAACEATHAALRTGHSALIQGWAFDPQGAVEAGIGAVHVWAKRQGPQGPQGPQGAQGGGGAAPLFLGEATLDVARPDVARAFDGAPSHAGFQLDARLAPGTYEITAYVWNVRTGRWEDARMVTITVK